ncbi:unnamed protein product [Symbiodinium natans]|uniref:Uncharacterized protein n=1 Tax=Symbiodinium natans TaxID=878477 RepID=A0A812J8K1_9DINO|nr:unnamed protein product [Symbiodinium natans]
MECRLEIGHSLIVIPDPEHTPGAHQTTFSCLPVASDDFYLLFFFLGATGYACAGAVGQATAGDNWGTVVAKVLMVLSSGALLLDSCCALEKACQKKFLKRGFFGLCIGLLAGGLLAALLVWGSHFQVTMYFLAASALLCCVAWATVNWCVGPVSGENLFRSLFSFLTMGGALVVALLEPSCGYAGHPECYAKCPGAPSIHFLIWAVPTILNSLGMTFLQLCAPEPLAFPQLWRYRPTAGSGPSPQAVPPAPA